MGGMTTRNRSAVKEKAADKLDATTVMGPPAELSYKPVFQCKKEPHRPLTTCDGVSVSSFKARAATQKPMEKKAASTQHPRKRETKMSDKECVLHLCHCVRAFRDELEEALFNFEANLSKTNEDERAKRK